MGKKFDCNSIVVFKLAGEIFGTFLQSVDEVLPMMKVEKVPRNPEFLEGLINLRGESIAVVNLRHYFGHKREDYFYETRILVTRLEGRKLGFIVDSVSDVRSLDGTSIEEPVIHTAQTRFLRGVTHLEDDQTVQLVAMDQILDAESLEQLKKTSFDS